ncbi:crispr-associated helicase Cas3, putative [Microscilla marina ATCC 23134]|uniref:RNA helicase n=1 Tax=Microscilla marina ATCC 23134 TaxID=313606 RepID=A1ZHZ3_MICM2|nr:crispr-associated helicase Cas3, putative [Microscilla marina ATCC 23134]
MLSALFTRQVAREYLATTNLGKFEQELLANYTFTVVKRHHGKLLDFEDELYALGNQEEKRAELAQQIEVFAEEETEEIIRSFAQTLGLSYCLEDFKEYIRSEQYTDELEDFYEDEFGTRYGTWQQLPDEVRMDYFFVHQFMFGSLLLADKTEVILDEERHKQRPNLGNDLVETFRKKKGFDQPVSRINQLKNQAYTQALEGLRQRFSPDQHIYSITLPTGLGKTITSFAVALEIKQMLGQQHRLVVTIPFTSIIDQNFEVYRDILNNESSRVLLKHHHLAEPAYKEIEDDESYRPLDVNKSQFLIETWQSEVVVTTFVQLLNSIYSNHKALVMKLPNLANAIIILDEIQTIPYAYWQLINRSFKAIGRLFNCYFVLMSATQPLIFAPEEEIIELVPDYAQYFRHFNRTRLINRCQMPVSMDDFGQTVAQYLQTHPKRDVLVILNTKKLSKQCFEQLRQLANEANDDLYYLSTLITPYERKQIIRKIKTPAHKRKVVVSTQLIEAGVDISVDTVFRALAPLDAIIQAAGRANRYNEKTIQGEVYLYEIEEMRQATSLIYGQELLQKTRNVLRNIQQIEECHYLSLIEAYFVEVRTQSEVIEQPYLEAIHMLQFEQVGAFSLIEEREGASVFVMINDEAQEAWAKYAEIYNDDSLKKYEQKRAFAQIKTVFYDYVINIHPQHAPEDIDKALHFYVVDPATHSEYYTYKPRQQAQNTGYQIIDASAKKTTNPSLTQNY